MSNPGTSIEGLGVAFPRRMNASPPQARADVSREHARVRELVDELVREALQTARKVGHRAIRERLTALRAAIEHMIDVEERELASLLAAANAWGPVRVERVRERHARMLAAVREFEDDLSAERHAGCDLVARTEELVRALSCDLEEERDALVATERAEEGTVPVDQESG